MTDSNSDPPPLPTAAVGEGDVDAPQADKKEEPAKGCAGFVGCFAMVILLSVIINVACPLDGFVSMTASGPQQSPDVGDQFAVAPQGGGGHAWGFTTDAAYEQGGLLLRAGDEAGLIEQLLNGTMVMLDRGDRLFVIGSQLNWASERPTYVRMQSGSFTGKMFLMRSGDVAIIDEKTMAPVGVRADPRRQFEVTFKGDAAVAGVRFFRTTDGESKSNVRGIHAAVTLDPAHYTFKAYDKDGNLLTTRTLQLVKDDVVDFRGSVPPEISDR